ncbi:11179_t:CDS:1, partial [Racocetra fulgida]
IAYKIAKEREGKCISTKYINAQNHLQWECKNEYKWFATLNQIKNKKTWCPNYRQHTIYKRLTLDDAKKLAYTKNGECLSAEYINSKTPMQWKCEKGHQWFARIDSIRNHNTWCLKCNHYSIETAKEIAYNQNRECLSTIYKDNKTLLQWKCNKGHIWIAHLNSIKDLKNWCPYCRGFNKTITDMYKLAQQRNGKCLSEKYN